MFSMAVAAMRRRRIAAAAALAAALIAPGAAAAAAAAPAAQASVSHPARTGGYGGSRAGNAALNWAEGHARGCWYSYGGSSCSRGYDCSGLVMAAFGHGAGIWLPHSTYSMLGQPAPAPDLAVAGPARRPDVLRLRARGNQHDLVPPDVRGASQRSARRLENMEPLVASHGRIPGLVTQDRPRAVKESCHGHRRGAGPEHPQPPPGIPACWRGCHVPCTARRKPARSSRFPPSLPAQAFALPGHTAAGRVSLASQRTDRPGNDEPGSEPSSAQARTGYGCPISP